MGLFWTDADALPPKNARGEYDPDANAFVIEFDFSAPACPCFLICRCNRKGNR